MSKDFYKVLGVDRNAKTEEISKAYRSHAMKYHPDRKSDDPNAAKLFKEAAEAFEVLNDPQKRKHYDMYGSTQNQRQKYSTSDIFNNIFGGFGGFSGFGTQQRYNKGATLNTSIEITLEEAYHGCVKDVVIKRHGPCETCKGTGAEDVETCKNCHGRGQITMQQGNFMISSTCRLCGGEGKIAKNKCKTCNGKGDKVAEKETLSVKVPAGVINHVSLIAGGHGHYSYDEPENQDANGDCRIEIVIKPHDFYEFHDRKVDLYTDHFYTGNLKVDVPITYSDTVFGTKVQVPLLNGKVYDLDVPPGVLSESEFIIANGGMPFQGVHGDLIAVIKVIPPDIAVATTKSPQFVDLWKEIKYLEDANVSEEIKDFNHKVKNILERNNE